MPFVRIDLPAGRDEAFKAAVGDAIHDAMVATITIPDDDRFQVISEHAAAELRYDRGYLGVDRSDQMIFAQITMKRGRSRAQKRALYAGIAKNLGQRLSWRPEDVMVILSENELIDWSFGKGEAQIAGED